MFVILVRVGIFEFSGLGASFFWDRVWSLGRYGDLERCS